jgi:GntR family transcriptional regulator
MYQQLAGTLRERIASGEVPVGGLLGTEADLMAEYEATRIVVRMALAVLRSEGLVHTVHARGTFVAERGPMPYRASVIQSRAVRDASNQGVYQAELNALGRTGGMTSVTIERTTAPEDVAWRLGLEVGDPVIVRRRVMEEGGRPSFLADSWFPAALVEGTEIAEPVPVERGTIRALEERHLLRLTWRRDEISARMPTPEEIEALQIPSGVPVLLVVATEMANQDHVPVEVYRQVRPADRHELVYDVDQSV